MKALQVDKFIAEQITTSSNTLDVIANNSLWHYKKKNKWSEGSVKQHWIHVQFSRDCSM